jgi:hypothetical protein
MKVTFVSSPDIIEAALNAAEKVVRPKGLNAPSEEVLGTLEKIWEEVRAGLHSAYFSTKAELKARVNELVSRVEGLIQRAGAKADELRRMLLDRLRAYLQAMIDQLLKQVRSEVIVGEGTRMRLTSVEVAQSIKLSGSVGLSLEKALEFTSDGELALTASYETVR